jgi:hypothetical protein
MLSGFLALDEFDAVGGSTGSEDFGIGGIKLSVDDILKDVEVEDVWFLHY